MHRALTKMPLRFSRSSPSRGLCGPVLRTLPWNLILSLEKETVWFAVFNAMGFHFLLSIISPVALTDQQMNVQFFHISEYYHLDLHLASTIKKITIWIMDSNANKISKEMRKFGQEYQKKLLDIESCILCYHMFT